MYSSNGDFGGGGVEGGGESGGSGIGDDDIDVACIGFETWLVLLAVCALFVVKY